MDLLTKLAEVYGTDKWGVHSYTPFYHELFKNEVIDDVLEIGILDGASLRMWQAYFPSADIWGFDIDPKRLVREGRIWSWEVDQRDAEAIKKTLELQKFDVIIDDASHEPQDQAFTANVLIPYLHDGGFYIIEDVREGNKERVQEAIKFPTRVVEFNIEKQTDDRLIICER